MKIVATSWHPSATNAIVPVIERLRARGDEVVVLGTKYANPIFERSRLSYTPSANYGVSEFPVGDMEKILAQENPNIVLGGTSFQKADELHVPDQTIVLAARNLGVPSLRVQDWRPFGKKYHDISTGERFRFLPDRIAVMNDYYAEEMVREGFPAEKVVVTGNPEIDTLQKKVAEFNEGKRRTVREGLGVKNGPVFYYSGGIEWKDQKEVYGYWTMDHLQIFSEVLKQVKGDINVIVTLHPRMPKEQKEEVLQYIQTIGDSRISSLLDLGQLKIDTEDLSLTSDAVLTAFSTVGIKAAYMGRACISLQPNLVWPSTFEDADPGFFVKYSSIIPLGLNKESCTELVKNATREEYVSELETRLSQSQFGSKGLETKATERVVNLIDEMANYL